MANTTGHYGSGIKAKTSSGSIELLSFMFLERVGIVTFCSPGASGFPARSVALIARIECAREAK